jgi:hypothetical protein
MIPFREGRAAEALTMKRQDGTAEMVYGGHAEVVQRVVKPAGANADRICAAGSEIRCKINAPGFPPPHYTSFLVLNRSDQPSDLGY